MTSLSLSFPRAVTILLLVLVYGGLAARPSSASASPIPLDVSAPHYADVSKGPSGVTFTRLEAGREVPEPANLLLLGTGVVILLLYSAWFMTPPGSVPVAARDRSQLKLR